MQDSPLAQRISLLQGEGAYKVLAQATALEAQGRNIIHLEIGQPNFHTPLNIQQAAFQAIAAGKTGYTAAQGLLETRQAIAEYCWKYKQVKTNPDEIVVTPGAKPIIFYTMLALINPGDEVICPNPGFPTYASCIHFTGGKEVALKLLAENSFQPDPDELRSLLNEKTKLVILNNPSNPTGHMISKERMLQLVEIIRDHSKAYILCDEIYDRLIFDQTQALSSAAVAGMKDRTILLDGFSKTYAMTGWRLGYGVMQADIAAAFSTLMVNSNGCAASFSQIAAIEALRGPQESVTMMRDAFAERSVWLAKALNQIDGIECQIPNSAFYVFPSVKKTGIGSAEFADRLLKEAGVAALDGESFGFYGKDHLRLSTANSMENIQAAAARIAAFTASLQATV